MLLDHDLLRLRLRLGLPGRHGDDVAGVSIDLNASSMDFLIAAVMAVGVVWASTRHMQNQAHPQPEASSDHRPLREVR